MDLKKRKKYIDRLSISAVKTAQCTTPDFPGLPQISDRSTNQFNK